MIAVLIGGLTVSESSIDSLLDANKAITGEIRARAEQELYNLKQREQELQQILSSPVPVKPVVSVAPNKAAKTVNPMKYYNPANPTQQWTGRGKPPAWFNRENPMLVSSAEAPVVQEEMSVFGDHMQSEEDSVQSEEADIMALAA